MYITRARVPKHPPRAASRGARQYRSCAALSPHSGSTARGVHGASSPIANGSMRTTDVCGVASAPEGVDRAWSVPPKPRPRPDAPPAPAPTPAPAVEAVLLLMVVAGSTPGRGIAWPISTTALTNGRRPGWYR